METLRRWHDNSAVRTRVNPLIDLALVDYRLRYPTVSHLVTNTWLFYDGDPTTVEISSPSPARVDVFCLFCRVLLVSNAIYMHDYSVQLRCHTTACALRSLAGEITPGAPGTYKLQG